MMQLKDGSFFPIQSRHEVKQFKAWVSNIAEQQYWQNRSYKNPQETRYISASRVSYVPTFVKTVNKIDAKYRVMRFM